MSGSRLGPRGRHAGVGSRAPGHDVENETPPPTDERGGGPLVIYRWPTPTTRLAPARDLVDEAFSACVNSEGAQVTHSPTTA